MTSGRIRAASVAGAIVIMYAFTAGRAFSQTRPGINALVKTPEGCSYSDPINTNDLYSFMQAQIQALALAQKGESGTLYTAASDHSTGAPADRFASLREERIGTTCAGFILSPYTKSDNRKAAAVADKLVAAYGELQKMTDERLGLEMQKSVQSSFGTPVRARLEELKNRRQGVIRNLNGALSDFFLLLIDEEQTGADGKPGRIVLTHEQRTSLRNFLQSQFPSLLVSDKNGTQPSDDFTRQAALIRSFLSGASTPAAK